MSPRKRASRIPFVSPVGNFAGFVVGPGRTLALGLIVVSLFGGAWYWGWEEVHGDVLTSPAYQLSADDIVVTSRPAWMSFDIREKVFYDASLQQNLSIMDRNLNERIAAAFALHPWVAKVNGVRKSYSAGVVVDLEYRRPVCMVHTCGKFIPVDVEGYALPAWDIPRSEIGRYPRVECPDLSTPRGPSGDKWGDPRVLGAARIADALGDRWKKYRLRLIEPIASTRDGVNGGTEYLLRTHSHSKVVWGRAPGMEVAGEPSTEAKLAYLDEEVKRYGNLEGPNGWPRDIPLQLLIQNQRSGQSQ